MASLQFSPYQQNIFQDILDDADIYYKKSYNESLNFDRNKIIASELMKLFYEKIHKKMFKKFIDTKKKIKLSLLDKAAIFYIFITRKIYY